ncbi:unnamed protein product [Paramecium octaurelia]|uniref:Uncharacterized protein n=1 Tax=Paramecium octaurelia TaxID=43137 RepID=A0A8S1VQK6_PAROT|nr:unnamed protein product [Paramecium octaurelia]
MEILHQLTLFRILNKKQIKEQLNRKFSKNNQEMTSIDEEVKQIMSKLLEIREQKILRLSQAQIHILSRVNSLIKKKRAGPSKFLEEGKLRIKISSSLISKSYMSYVNRGYMLSTL